MPASLLAASAFLSTTAILGSLLTPVSRPAFRLPEVERQELSGPEADLYLAPRRPSPGIVLVLGALREGRRYPLLVTVARTLAACGYAVLVPELGRLRQLILGADALEDLIKATLRMGDLPGVTSAPVGLFGFSLGGSLALLATADDRLRGHVACVASMGAYFSLEDMLAATTVGTKGIHGEVILPAAPSVYTVAASLIAGVPDPDRTFLDHVLDENANSPLEAVSRIDLASVGLEAQAVLALLDNRDPAAIPGLISKFEPAASMISKLSPEQVIDRIQVPVWVLHDQRDRYVPFQQLQAMRRAVAGRPNFRFFGIRLLEHTEPVPPGLKLGPLLGDYLPGVFVLFRFAHGPLSVVRNSRPRP